MAVARSLVIGSALHHDRQNTNGFTEAYEDCLFGKKRKSLFNQCFTE